MKNLFKFCMYLVLLSGVLFSISSDDLSGNWVASIGADSLYLSFQSDSLLIFDDERLNFRLENNAIHIDETFGSIIYPISLEGNTLYIDFADEGYTLQFHNIDPINSRSYQQNLEWNPTSIQPGLKMGVNTWVNPGSKKLSITRGKHVEKTIRFEKVHDHNYAFSILRPENWIFEGGSYTNRLIGNQGEPRIHIQVKNNEKAEVALHMYPAINYYLPARMLPLGSQFQGGYILNKLSPIEYLAEIILNNERPNARNICLVRKVQLLELAESLEQSAEGLNLTYQAEIGVFEYEENGVRYLESGFVMIQSSVDFWTNLFTVTFRAPAESFTEWEPVLDAILKSVKPNPLWIKSILDGMKLSKGLLSSDENLTTSNFLIFNEDWTGDEKVALEWDVFLSQSEEYINPFTLEIEKVPSHWTYRWQHENGNVVLTGENSTEFIKSLKKQKFRRSVKRIISTEN